MKAGDIVHFELILFDDGLVDHPTKKGRPCVYIGEKDDVMYFIPLRRMQKKKYDLSCYVLPDKYNNLKVTSLVNFHTIIEKQARFFSSNGYITDDIMYDIMRQIVLYFKETYNEQSKVVKELASEYLNKKPIKYKDMNYKKQGKIRK